MKLKWSTLKFDAIQVRESGSSMRSIEQTRVEAGLWHKEQKENYCILLDNIVKRYQKGG